MAAPSSSAFDVFLTFRGPDTRFGFTSHLCKALRQSRIHVFMDERIESSRSILQAIERSRIAIVIFSPQFASSRWCLDDLVKIMECRTTQAQVVIPIFFDVDPFDVSKQRGTYGKAMEVHEQILVEETDRVLRWRQALHDCANLSSCWTKNCDESELVEKIVEEVSRILLWRQVHEELEFERTNYDVFLSFGGKDTHLGFTSHLHKALRRIGIHAFMDDKEIITRRGEEISGSTQQAIETSRIALVSFSPDCASSRWCLDEVVKIMECKRTKGQVVIPIFHEVKPSDVRHQSGSYVEAAKVHEDRGIGIAQVDRWREALEAATSMAGFSSTAYRLESEMVDEIVKDVCKKLKVGIDSQPSAGTDY